MNETFFDQNINIYTDIPVPAQATQVAPTTTTGSIILDYAKGKSFTADALVAPAKPDLTEISKLDYVAPEDLEPQNRFMDWHKKHPQGQNAPMKSENKMVSNERKI